MSRMVMRTLALGLLLSGGAFAAEGVSLRCPAGTKQVGGKVDGVYCARLTAQGSVARAHGPYAGFHASGQKLVEGQYVDGLKVGTWTFYDEAGRVTGQTEFSEGVYHGKRVQFFPSGSPRLVEEYSRAQRNGAVQEFAEDGALVRQVLFVNGRPQVRAVGQPVDR